MSHVADGELHAWLDGALAPDEPARAARVRAHLEACPDCRARLAETRALRDRAAAILSGADPEDVAPPPFTEVLAEHRARTGTPGAGGARSRSGGPGPAWAIAWAASLVLAVGLGWVLRPVDGEGPGGPEVAVREARPAEDRAAGSREREVAPAEAAPAEAAPAEGEAAGRRERQQRPAEGRAAPEPEPSADREGYAAKRREAAADRAPEARARIAGEEAEEDAARASEAEAPREGAAAAGEAPVAQAAPPAALTAERAADPPSFRDDGPPWIPVGTDHAERWVGGRVVRVPELPLLEVAISTRAGVPVVRTVQALDDVRRLTLHQRPAGAAGREDAREPGEGAAGKAREEADEAAGGGGVGARTAAPSRLTIVVDGFSITAEAPVASDSLRVLLSRAR